MTSSTRYTYITMSPQANTYCASMVDQGRFLTSSIVRFSFQIIIFSYFRSIEQKRVINMPPEKDTLILSCGCCANVFQYHFLRLSNPIDSPCLTITPLRCIVKAERFEGLLSAFCTSNNFLSFVRQLFSYGKAPEIDWKWYTCVCWHYAGKSPTMLQA